MRRQPLVTPLRAADPNQPCGKIRTIRDTDTQRHTETHRDRETQRDRARQGKTLAAPADKQTDRQTDRQWEGRTKGDYSRSPGPK